MRRLIHRIRQIDWLSTLGYAAGIAGVVMLYAVTQNFDNQAVLTVAGRQ